MRVKTILVIEDEKPLATALSLKLEKEGYSVLTAYDGVNGLALMEQNSIDLILLDLMLPGMDGFKFLENLQKKGISVLTIVLSNLSQEEDIARVKALGAKDYFVKSDTPIRDIVTYVKTLLHEPPE